ncbi:hypothetical protein BU17DRAFT_64194 [Hysterangium stoloniferum]|nr:hypothetical protein BU17DRAFT_64194 [Hysterangium stoloniferum]
MAHSVMACHLYVICSIEPSVGSRRTRWSNRRTTGLPVPMRADVKQPSAQILLQYCTSLHLIGAVAGGIDIGSSAKTKPFIDVLRPDPTPIERPVDRSPTGFAEEGPCREDRSHPRKAQRRRKRKQDGRGVPFNSNIQEAHGSRNNSCPKTPTQSPEKEKEKETGSRCISFNSNVRGRVALTVAAPPNGYQRTRSSLTVTPLDEITTLHRTLRHLLKLHDF